MRTRTIRHTNRNGETDIVVILSEKVEEEKEGQAKSGYWQN